MSAWNQKVFEGVTRSFVKFIIVDEVTKTRTKLMTAKFYVKVEFGLSFQIQLLLNQI